jgi:hypothetical protein
MSIPSSVQERLKRFDPALRLREVQGPDPESERVVTLIALERRDRAGTYQRIGTVRPDLLGDGSGLIAKLHASDLRQINGSGEAAADRLDETEREERRARQAFRQQELLDQGKEAYDLVARRTGRRVNNAGVPNG